MGVLAADKRLTVVLCQKFSDLFYGSIHLAFYIARFIVCPVAEYALVMHKPGRIRFPQELRHLKDILPSKGFVSTGPDQYGWMVFVSLIHGIRPVQHHIEPFRFIVGNHKRLVQRFPHIVPGSMRLQIHFIDQIKPVFIAKPVKHGTVGIMTGTDRVDVIPFHCRQILSQLLF